MNPKPSDKPTDLLEVFAEFAISMLHSGVTENCKAFQQALVAWIIMNGKLRNT